MKRGMTLIPRFLLYGQKSLWTTLSDSLKVSDSVPALEKIP